MSKGLQCDEQQTFHHVHHHDNGMKASDSGVQNQALNYFSGQNVDYLTPAKKKVNSIDCKLGLNGTPLSSQPIVLTDAFVFCLR